jgi:cbb3-type cytochrome oxidase subunit 3
MLKDVLRYIDYSDTATWALILFVLAFGLMIYATLRLSRKATDRFASIPLSDQVQDPRDE